MNEIRLTYLYIPPIGESDFSTKNTNEAGHRFIETREMPLSDEMCYLFFKQPNGRFQLIQNKNKKTNFHLLENGCITETDTPRNTDIYAYFINNAHLDFSDSTVIASCKDTFVKLGKNPQSITINSNLFLWIYHLSVAEQNRFFDLSFIFNSLFNKAFSIAAQEYPEPLKKSLLWMRNNRYAILKNGTAINMRTFFDAINEYREEAGDNKKLYRTLILDAAKDTVQNKGLTNYWPEAVKRKCDPLKLTGAFFGYNFAETHTGSKFTDTVSLYLNTIEDTLNAEDGNINTIKHKWSQDLEFKDPSKEDNVLITANQNNYYGRRTAFDTPNIFEWLSSYNNTDKNGYEVFKDNIINKIFVNVRSSRIEKTDDFSETPDYTFFVRTYNLINGTTKETKYSIEIQSEDEKCDSKEKIDRYIPLLIRNFKTIAKAAEMDAGGILRFTAETARLYLCRLKKELGENKQLLSYAFSVILKTIAEEFKYNGDTPVKYKSPGSASLIEFDRRFTIINAFDSADFIVTGLYILGFTSENIHETGTGSNSKLMIDCELSSIDGGKGVPCRVKSVYKLMNHFDYHVSNEKILKYAYSNFDITGSQDSSDQIFLYDAAEENGKKTYTPVNADEHKELINTIKTNPQSLKAEGRYISWVPNNPNSYYSNSIRNLLADTNDLFDFYYATDLEGKDKTGMIGFTKSTVKETRGYDASGNEVKFDADYVDHAYVMTGETTIGHSIKDKGLCSDTLKSSIQQNTKYFLELNAAKKSEIINTVPQPDSKEYFEWKKKYKDSSVKIANIGSEEPRYWRAEEVLDDGKTEHIVYFRYTGSNVLTKKQVVWNYYSSSGNNKDLVKRETTEYDTSGNITFSKTVTDRFLLDIYKSIRCTNITSGSTPTWNNDYSFAIDGCTLSLSSKAWSSARENGQVTFEGMIDRIDPVLFEILKEMVSPETGIIYPDDFGKHLKITAISVNSLWRGIASQSDTHYLGKAIDIGEMTTVEISPAAPVRTVKYHEGDYNGNVTSENYKLAMRVRDWLKDRSIVNATWDPYHRKNKLPYVYDKQNIWHENGNADLLSCNINSINMSVRDAVDKGKKSEFITWILDIRNYWDGEQRPERESRAINLYADIQHRHHVHVSAHTDQI